MEQLKADINKLMQQRKAIETEIEERSKRLNEPGQPGMSGSLLDKEGFPRSDIDIHAVRTHRNAVVRLTNDHKQLSTQLEQLLHKLHALARETGSVGPTTAQPTGSTAATAAAVPAAAAATESHQHEDKKPKLEPPASPPAAATDAAALLRPFAVVDEVTDNSPAAAAGVQLGDQLCKFGGAVAGSGQELQQVAQELQSHENQAVQVVFLRAGQTVHMQLVPRKWEGRGLLGCHLRPM